MGRPRSAMNEENVEIVRELIKKDKKRQKWHFDYQPFPVFTLCSMRFLLFRMLHLAMKGKRYAHIEDIQRSIAAILNIIFTDEIKMSQFTSRACKAVYWIRRGLFLIKYINFANNIFSFLDFYLVWELLRQTLYKLVLEGRRAKQLIGNLYGQGRTLSANNW